MKIRLSKKRRELLKKRYNEGKIAAFNDHSATRMKNMFGEYCLIGACLEDDEITQFKNNGEVFRTYSLAAFNDGRWGDICTIHDDASSPEKTYQKNRLREVIESLIEEGEAEWTSI